MKSMLASNYVSGGGGLVLWIFYQVLGLQACGMVLDKLAYFFSF